MIIDRLYPNPASNPSSDPNPNPDPKPKPNPPSLDGMATGGSGAGKQEPRIAAGEGSSPPPNLKFGIVISIQSEVEQKSFSLMTYILYLKLN